MKFELPKSDPDHAAISAAFDKLISSQLLAGLIIETEKRIQNNDNTLVPQIIIGAARMWVRDIADSGYTPANYSAQEMLDGITCRIYTAHAAYTLQQRGKPPPPSDNLRDR